MAQFEFFGFNFLTEFFSYLADGKTKSGEEWRGPIGQIISGRDKPSGLERGPMVNFKPISGLMPHVEWSILKGLSQDVRNLYRLCWLVQVGYKKADEEMKKAFNCRPGKVTKSRWITCANNVLCLYMQTTFPSKNLILLVQIILNLYGPTIFNIKKNPHVSQGPIHYYNIVKMARNLLEKKHPACYKEVVKVLTNNPFMAHIENILLAMVMDDDPDVNSEAVKVIDTIRKKKKKAKTIRKFLKPKDIDFNATNYYKLIDLSKVKAMYFCSPPLLNKYTIEDIKAKNFSKGFLSIPCHSQACERYVFLTSQAAESVVGEDKRNQFIINKDCRAERMPKNPTKQDLVQLVQKDLESNA